jgi:hypothetical protein
MRDILRVILLDESIQPDLDRPTALCFEAILVDELRIRALGRIQRGELLELT